MALEKVHNKVSNKDLNICSIEFENIKFKNRDYIQERNQILYQIYLMSLETNVIHYN